MPWRFSQLSGPHTRTTTNFRLWAVTTTIWPTISPGNSMSATRKVTLSADCAWGFSRSDRRCGKPDSCNECEYIYGICISSVWPQNAQYLCRFFKRIYTWQPVDVWIPGSIASRSNWRWLCCLCFWKYRLDQLFQNTVDRPISICSHLDGREPIVCYFQAFLFILLFTACFSLLLLRAFSMEEFHSAFLQSHILFPGEPRYIFLMVLSILLGYIEGILIERKKHSRLILAGASLHSSWTFNVF